MTGIQREISWYISELEAPQRYSAATIKAYQRDLNLFASFVNDMGIELIGPNNIRDFISLLNKKGYAGTTIQRCLSSLRVFFDSLEKENKINSNPAALVAAPKKQKLLPRTLDTDQVCLNSSILVMMGSTYSVETKPYWSFSMEAVSDYRN